MTQNELRIRTLRMLGVTDSSPLHWTQDQVRRAINRAYLDFARESGALEMRGTFAVTNGKGEYTMPTTMRRLLRVAFDDRVLCPETHWKMDRSAYRWEEETGYVEAFIEDIENDRVLRLYRIPTGLSGPGVSFAADSANNSDHTDADFGLTAWTNLETTTFAADTANNAAHTDAELGIVVSWTLTDGTVVEFRDESGSESGGQSGVTTSMEYNDDELEVWAKRVPPALSGGEDEPELPRYSHLGLCFKAASILLRHAGDGRNEELAASYEALAMESLDFLKQEVGRRTPERLYHLGGRSARGRENGRGRFYLGDDITPYGG